MLIRKEEFINENGVEMIRELYGPNEKKVTGKVEYAKPVEGAMPAEQVPEATQLDRIEAQTAYIAMMMDGGEV